MWGIYELAFGAKLNLAKLVIIPPSVPMVPQWFHATSYTTNNPGEVHKYLGAPFSNQLNKIDTYNFCLDKISKCILGWSNRLLSFIGKVLLIKHVL